LNVTNLKHQLEIGRKITGKREKFLLATFARYFLCYLFDGNRAPDVAEA
jgi:hypothetical protein